MVKAQKLQRQILQKMMGRLNCEINDTKKLFGWKTS